MRETIQEDESELTSFSISSPGAKSLYRKSHSPRW
jgi:hypothetical protein